MYSRYWRDQSGVAEQSDANDRLRNALGDGFQISFTENKENSVTN